MFYVGVSRSGQSWGAVSRLEGTAGCSHETKPRAGRPSEIPGGSFEGVHTAVTICAQRARETAHPWRNSSDNKDKDNNAAQIWWTMCRNECAIGQGITAGGIHPQWALSITGTCKFPHTCIEGQSWKTHRMDLLSHLEVLSDFMVLLTSFWTFTGANSWIWSHCRGKGISGDRNQQFEGYPTHHLYALYDFQICMCSCVNIAARGNMWCLVIENGGTKNAKSLNPQPAICPFCLES